MPTARTLETKIGPDFYLLYARASATGSEKRVGARFTDYAAAVNSEKTIGELAAFLRQVATGNIYKVAKDFFENSELSGGHSALNAKSIHAKWINSKLTVNFEQTRRHSLDVSIIFYGSNVWLHL